VPLQRHTNTPNYQTDIVISSQVRAPKKLFDVLLVTAIKESWIIAVINLHVAIFFGLILLATGYDPTISLIYLIIQLSVSTLVGILLIFLINQKPERVIEKSTHYLTGLLFSDGIIALGWGVSILMFFMTASIDQTNMLVALLLAAGISTAAMSAKLVRVLISGRVLLFLPTIIYLILQQPPNWLLHSTSLVIGFAVCLAVGYAIHVQLLREAFLVVQLGETQKKIIEEAEFRELFLKAITHDLRQPISATKLFFRHLKKAAPNIRDSVDASNIDQCLQTAKNIIDDFAELSWVRTKLPKIEAIPLSVSASIEHVIKIHQSTAERSNIKLSSLPTDEYCLGNPTLLERAIGNLIKNAIQHSDAERISIETKPHINSSEIEIQVRDNGKGISQADQDKLFEPFKIDNNGSSNITNMNIGLSIVDNIINAHNGRVVVDSKLGHGSCFSIFLPSTKKVNQANSVSINRVVIIDDDENFVNELAAKLEQLGLSVATLTQAKDIIALKDMPLPTADAYLIDYQLGDFLTGDSLLSKISPNALSILISDRDDLNLFSIAADYQALFISKSNLSIRLPELLNIN